MVDLQSYAILFTIWLISILVVRAIVSKPRTTVRLPPSPMSIPILGHLHLLGPIAHQALHKLSTRYGPLIHLRLGSVPCVVAASPETAKELLKTHEHCFASRPQSVAVKYLTYGSADFSFAPYGPYWKFMKKMCMSELLGGRTLTQFTPVRREEIVRFLENLLTKSEAREAVNIGEELLTLSNNVISRMTMSRTCSDTEGEAAEVRGLVKEVAELAGMFNLADFIGFCRNLDLQGFDKRLKDVRRRFDVMMETIMKEHEDVRKKKKEMDDEGEGEGDGVKDILDILLDAMEDKNSEMNLTRENIKAFILDIFVAGTDTSAITTEWALAELINHPTLFEKARKEIDSVIGKSRLVEELDVPNLPYLQAIVKETLRLHPTGPLIIRESTEDCKIGEYEILAKTQVFVNVWSLGRDPNYWENPLEFKPERFMSSDEKSSNSIEVRGQHFHMLPFGTGRRGCPGTSLALHVVQATLGAMLQCFDWKVGNGETNTMVDMREGPGITLPRAHPLVGIPIARLNPLPSINI